MTLADKLAAVAPFALALAIGAALLAATGHEPLGVYRLMVEEAFGGERRLAATLTAATPLLLTGLAAAVAFRAGVFNVGAEGCFYLGGLVAAVAGYRLGDWPALLLIPLALALAALIGAAWMVLPAALRARLDVDEVVTTLMLNFVAIGFASWLVNGPLLARGSANSATPPIAPHAELPRLLPPTTLHLGFVLSLALVIAYGFWGRLTVGGFRSRLVGLNARFSRAVGIEPRSVVFSTMIVSGAIGGLAGGIHALGLVHRFVAGFSPGYGFTGVAIALLARNSAVGVAAAAILFGALSSAGANIQLFSDVPIEIVEILQGAVMIFAVAKFGRPGAEGVVTDDFLRAALLMTTPILLAAIGGLINRIGGLVNLGLESMMLAGALVAVQVSAATGSAALAVLAAAATGALVGLAMSLVVTRLRANEIIVGLGFTVAVAGLVRYLLKSLYGASGTYHPPGVAMLPRFDIPFLDGVPVMGALLSRQDPLTWAAWAFAPLTAFALHRTRWGLRLGRRAPRKPPRARWGSRRFPCATARRPSPGRWRASRGRICPSGSSACSTRASRAGAALSRWRRSISGARARGARRWAPCCSASSRPRRSACKAAACPPTSSRRCPISSSSSC